MTATESAQYATLLMDGMSSGHILSIYPTIWALIVVRKILM